MTYHSLSHTQLSEDAHLPEVAAFIKELTTVIEQAPLPNRIDGSLEMGRLTEKALLESLQLGFPKINWLHDKKLIVEGRRDRADFYTEIELGNKTFICIIEADPTRGDAIAKKFVSRVACITNSPLIYVTLCFKGTQKGTISESKKYMEFCASICTRLSTDDNPIVYLGFMPSS